MEYRPSLTIDHRCRLQAVSLASHPKVSASVFPSSTPASQLLSGHPFLRSAILQGGAPTVASTASAVGPVRRRTGDKSLTPGENRARRGARRARARRSEGARRGRGGVRARGEGEARRGGVRGAIVPSSSERPVRFYRGSVVICIRLRRDACVMRWLKLARARCEAFLEADGFFAASPVNKLNMRFCMKCRRFSRCRGNSLTGQ